MRIDRTYISDFETFYDGEFSRVWAYGITSLDSERFEYGNCIETFVDLLLTLTYSEMYFHNAKFDVSYLIPELHKRGFEFVGGFTRTLKAGQVSYATDDLGNFYQMVIKTDKEHFVVIKDTAKIFNQPLKNLLQTFGDGILKGDIDHTVPRFPGHQITEDELKYLKHDVLGLKKVVETIKRMKVQQLTASAFSLNTYKLMMLGESLKIDLNLNDWDDRVICAAGSNPKKKLDQVFRNRFPILDEQVDAVVRKAYLGGYVYTNPKFQNQLLNKPGKTFDINSSYPAVLKDKPLPYGTPVEIPLTLIGDEIILNEKLFCQFITFRCSFSLRDGKFPTIPGSVLSDGYDANTYYEKSINEHGELTTETITLTHIDYRWFRKHYDVINFEVISHLSFRVKNDMFKNFIEKMSKEKTQNEVRDGVKVWLNQGEVRTHDFQQYKSKVKREASKLLMNGLTGKFGSGTSSCSQFPEFDDFGCVSMKRTDEVAQEPIYIPMASMILAHARDNLFSAIEGVGMDQFCYCDTDSIHFLEGENEFPKHMIDDSKLGYWKLEYEFTRANFMRAKTYLEETQSGFKCACAGLSKDIQDQLTFDNFRLGNEFPKKTTKRLKTGEIIIEISTFVLGANVFTRGK